MRVIYTGPHDGVEVRLPDGTMLTVERGGELVTTDGHGAALLEQTGNWQHAKDEPPADKKSKPAGKTDSSAADPAEGGD